MTTRDQRVGWSAECQDCPPVREPEYGALLYPREEFDDTDEGRHAAERWAITHQQANPGHRPKVLQFAHWTMTVEHLDENLLRILFSEPDTP